MWRCEAKYKENKTGYNHKKIILPHVKAELRRYSQSGLTEGMTTLDLKSETIKYERECRHHLSIL